MEEYLDLIIIIAAVAISVVSSVSKAKKQKAQKKAEPQTGSPDNDDPWESIKRYFEDGKDNEEEDEEVYYEEEEDDFIPEPVLSPATSAAPKDIYNTGAYDDYSVKTAVTDNVSYGHNQDGYAKPEIREVKQKVSLNDISQAIDNDAVIEDFDLRAAIIYSEILKPKFED